MCKNQRLIRFRSFLAIAAVAVALVAPANVQAAARADVAMQPSWAGREHVKVHRDPNFAQVRVGATYVPSVPPDYCDLPSAGCESYLSN